MYALSAFNASSTSKLLKCKEGVQESLKLLNGQKRISNGSFLPRLYKDVFQEEK